MSSFKKAIRKKLRARIALVGPPGSGKTMTSLIVAGMLGARNVALIDTERGSASKYVGEPGVPDFDVVEMTSFGLEAYIKLIQEAGASGYDALIVDSMSHGWNGTGGALDTVSKKSNDQSAWRPIDALMNTLVGEIQRYPGHVFATFRTKNDYEEVVGKGGKKQRRKVGLAPIFKEGLEYEYDIVLYLDDTNIIHIDKTRCAPLGGQDFRQPDETARFAEIVRAWCEAGETEEERIGKLFAAVTNPAELAAAKEELKRAVHLKALDRAAADRVIAIGANAAQRLEATAAQAAAEESVGSGEAADG